VVEFHDEAEQQHSQAGKKRVLFDAGSDQSKSAPKIVAAESEQEANESRR